MVVKEEAPVKDAKGRKTVRPRRDEEVYTRTAVCACVKIPLLSGIHFLVADSS